jgi:F0F1-type ATP synthase membrane subunit b/b'
MLDFPPDITFVIQFVAFFVLFFALDRLLFKPYAEILTQRDARTVGMSRSADEDQHIVRDLRARIDAEIATARGDAQREAEAVRKEARTEEAALYERAKDAAAARLAALGAALDAERAAAGKALTSDAKALAEQMARVVLGEKA